MKKMLLATALALLITGCAQQTFTVQNKPAAVAPKEAITHHFFVSGIGQKKTVVNTKFVAAENVVKTETQQTFVNGLLGFITLGIYTPRWKYSSSLSLWFYRYGVFSFYSRRIFWVLQVWWPFANIRSASLLRGEIIPFSGVCQSVLSTPEAMVTARLTDCWCAADDDQRHHHASIIFSFSIS